MAIGAELRRTIGARLVLAIAFSPVWEEEFRWVDFCFVHLSRLPSAGPRRVWRPVFSAADGVVKSG
jgi:hypothetical protein